MPTTNNHTIAPVLEQDRDHLAQLVEELQRAQKTDRQTIADLTEERDLYLRAVYAWSRSQISQEQLQKWAGEKETGDTFEQVLAELTSSP